MFRNFEPREDRDKFLLFLMQNAPVMRIRGHGTYAAFEYSSSSKTAPMDAVAEWGRREAGPFTGLDITNFATRENTVIRWEDFEKAVDEGGYDAVMRVAGVRRMALRWRVARELLALSKEILAQGPARRRV
jgi:hypothetical protein